MYPANVFSLFPPFPREDNVFVAMSFETRFVSRWENVIAPAIRLIRNGDKKLEPIRVDTRNISDSILTEILIGIANSCLIFADITTIGELNGGPIRNGNVMYEVGLEQSVRLPEEVVLFCSDQDRLLFDTLNIRVNNYAPDTNPDEAISKVGETLEGALKELDLRKHMTVQKAAEGLDVPCFEVLMEVSQDTGLSHSEMKTMRNVMGNSSRVAAISRLLELGALRTKYTTMTPESLAKDKDQPINTLLNYEKQHSATRCFWI